MAERLQPTQSDVCGADMGTTHFFIRFISVSESFDSTQLMTLNGFTRLDSNQLTTQNGFLKFDSNRLMTQAKSISFCPLMIRL